MAQNDPDPEAVASTFLSQLADGAFEEARERFDSPMRSAMSLEQLELTWKALVARIGVFEKITDTRHELTGMFHVLIMTCAFENGSQDIKVVLNNAMEVSGLWILPPEQKSIVPPYADQASFEETEVDVGQGEWVLPGTVTMPKGDGPFPAVVLVHGSGPHDRDETIGPNKPFRDLAWGLASHGVAVLRYEKRTQHYQGKLLDVPDGFTVNEETVDDAAAAVNTLRFTPKIDNGRIFVLGHSLGGMLAPRIAAKSPDVAGLIILAGATRPMGELLLEQVEYVFGLDGQVSQDEHLSLKKTRELVAKMNDPNLSSETPSAELPFGVPASYWLDLRAYKPAEAAAQLDLPMLILQGGRDYQVTEADFAGWREAVGARDNVTLELMPSLNHLFMVGVGKSTPNEYAIPGNVAEQAVQKIADWVKAQQNK
jgi:uncharacterized protein